MRVFIDFDYTVCNTQKVKADIRALPNVYGWDVDRFLLSQQRVLERGHYSLRAHLVEYGCSPAECAAVERDFFSDGSRWLYSDAIDFLERNAEHELYILSYGDVAFQRAKIEASGVAALVSDVICVAESKVSGIAEIISADEVFVVIDDRAKHLDDIAESYPNARCVRMLRPESPYLSEVVQAAVVLVQDLSFAINELQ